MDSDFLAYQPDDLIILFGPYLRTMMKMILRSSLQDWASIGLKG
ncbi:hypothetical protein QIA25_05210 (plasmid) [Borreliella spielmanii]|uniref:Uncharacterized protein n=1 Tax=Borreliella spielmanii A14S TaxID=498742 RepID=C0RBK3_9SPIR|nr:hypothetical protein BSPA14S_J0011 [Borreliella spielmanii A14S]